MVLHHCWVGGGSLPARSYETPADMRARSIQIGFVLPVRHISPSFCCSTRIDRLLLAFAAAHLFLFLLKSQSTLLLPMQHSSASMSLRLWFSSFHLIYHDDRDSKNVKIEIRIEHKKLFSKNGISRAWRVALECNVCHKRFANPWTYNQYCTMGFRKPRKGTNCSSVDWQLWNGASDLGTSPSCMISHDTLPWRSSNLFYNWRRLCFVTAGNMGSKANWLRPDKVPRELFEFHRKSCTILNLSHIYSLPSYASEPQRRVRDFCFSP